MLEAFLILRRGGAQENCGYCNRGYLHLLYCQYGWQAEKLEECLPLGNKGCGIFDSEYFSHVSKAFWDSESFLPYFLEKPMPIDLSFDEFSRLIDPSGSFYNGSPQSSTKLAAPLKLANIVSMVQLTGGLRILSEVFHLYRELLS